MIRILQHSKAFHTTLGGVERVVEELVPALNRFTDVQVDVLCQGASSRTYSLENRGTVYQAKVDLTVSSATLSREDLRIWGQVRRDYDIVHVHLPWPQSNLNLWLRRFDGAVVVHWHSDVVRQRFLYAGYRWLERWLLQRADRICATSPKLLEESEALQPFRHKGQSIPIGIPPAKDVIDKNDVLELQASHDRRPIIFTLGRLVPYKGLEYLVRCAPLLRSDGLILIGGDGPLRGELESLVHQAGTQSRVRFLGKLSDREVELHMRACAVFCLPSVQKSEAFGIVQIEAMRAGRPVVSCKIRGSGVDWVNQHGTTGITVDAQDPAALASALNEIVANPDVARRYGENARRRYEERFTAERMTADVRALYATLRL